MNMEERKRVDYHQVRQEYSLGLDIGTSSVGWCVTDRSDNFVTYKRRKMWGVRLFEEGETAAGRRLFRSTRRRLQRRRTRIALLQELIGKEVLAVDPSFFIRLRDSFLVRTDRSTGTAYNLFVSNDFTDRDYFKQFPTVFHLRKKLVESNEKLDIRLVYLAIHHILKYRGNFLLEGSIGSVISPDKPDEFEERFKAICKQLEIEDLPDNLAFSRMVKALLSKASRAERSDILKAECGRGPVLAMARLILGYSVKLGDILGNAVEGEAAEAKIDFTKEDGLEAQIERIGDQYPAFEGLFELYSTVTVRNIMEGHATISDAMVARFEAHQEDLLRFKRLLKSSYPRAVYDEMFKWVPEGKDRYRGGIYGMAMKAPRKFQVKYKNGLCKEAEAILVKNPQPLSEDYLYCMARIAEGEFLQKINLSVNGVIPYQLHEEELIKILQHQGRYYSVLNEKAEKIQSILKFRIPYYIGPLNPKSDFAWISRDVGRIYPWNFDQMVDDAASAEGFINRMRNSCTYLPSEETLPRHSLLFSEFKLLNELNKVRLGGKLMDQSTRQLVIEKLFRKQKSVSKKSFENFLRQEHIPFQGELSGFQGESGFANSLASYIVFSRILGGITEPNQAFIEGVLKDIALFEDKKILKRRITEAAERAGITLSEGQLKSIISLPFRGWGSLSKRFLDGIRTSRGETVIETMRVRPMNLMEIISNQELGIKVQVAVATEEFFGVQENTGKDPVDGLHGSPAIKRGVRQALRIVDEIARINGGVPGSIFLEFAREDGEKKRTRSRYDQILEKYKADASLVSSDLTRQLKGFESDKAAVSEEKVTLYFLQQGKCMYTGEALDLERLTDYHVDHIIPRALIKDDGLDNKVLVTYKSNVTKLDSPVVPEEARNRMKPFWLLLKSQGLLTDRKFYNLTRTTFEERDFEGFINRQLVETRQIIKSVTALLRQRYPDVHVYAIKSGVLSSFRERYGILKVRSLNHLHHAQDAYIATVIGNAILSSSTAWIIQEHEYGKYSYSEAIRKVKGDTKQGWVMGVVSRQIEPRIEAIKKRMWYRDYLVTKQTEEQRGEFYNQTRVSKDAKEVLSGKALPIKAGLDPKKYGGYISPNEAYSLPVEFTEKGKRKRQLLGIPIHVAALVRKGTSSYEKYLTNFGYVDVRVLGGPIMKYQVFLMEGGRYTLSSSSEMANAKQLIITNLDILRTLWAIEKDKDLLKEGITKADVLAGYDTLVAKMAAEYPALSGVAEKLVAARAMFAEKDEAMQKKVIMQILKITQCSAAYGDLSMVGGGTESGRMSKKTFHLDKIEFVSQSVTGLFEYRYRL